AASNLPFFIVGSAFRITLGPEPHRCTGLVLDRAVLAWRHLVPASPIAVSFLGVPHLGLLPKGVVACLDYAAAELPPDRCARRGGLALSDTVGAVVGTTRGARTDVTCWSRGPRSAGRTSNCRMISATCASVNR